MKTPVSPLLRLSLSALTLTTALGFATASQADTIGLHAGAGIWQADIGGEFGVSQTITTNELGLSGEDANYFYLALEHPVPVLPNIRITQTDLEARGTNTLESDFVFDEVVFPAGTEVATGLDLSHTDYTLYYEILDNIASADIGATFRSFDGGGAIRATSGNESLSESVDFSETAPMLYGRVQIDLPLSGFYVGGTINYIGLDDDKLQDLEARVGYMYSAVAASLGLELGYRKMSVQVDADDDLEVDLDFDGTYAAIVFHF